MHARDVEWTYLHHALVQVLLVVLLLDQVVHQHFFDILCVFSFTQHWDDFIAPLTLDGCLGVKVICLPTWQGKQLTVIKVHLRDDEVPIRREVPCQVMDWASSDLYCDIMPRHSRLRPRIEATHHKIPREVDVSDPEVTKICSTP